MPIRYVDTSKLPDRRENDFYPTPRKFVEAIAELWRELEYDGNKDYIRYIVDPGCAETGVWADCFSRQLTRVRTIGVDIRDFEQPECIDDFYPETDYLQLKLNNIDMVVGNPPYEFEKEFISHAYSSLVTGGYLIFLLKLSFLESKKRYKAYFESPLTRPKYVVVSSNRIPFTGQSNPDAFCVVIWKKGWSGETTLKWVNWK